MMARAVHTPCALAGSPGHRCQWIQAVCLCGRRREPDAPGWLAVRVLSDTPGQGLAVTVCSLECLPREVRDGVRAD